MVGINLPEDKKIYNYRYSKAQRTIENTFAILAVRWRIFLTPILASVENVDKNSCACMVLHNYLRQTNNAIYTPTHLEVSLIQIQESGEQEHLQTHLCLLSDK